MFDQLFAGTTIDIAASALVLEHALIMLLLLVGLLSIRSVWQRYVPLVILFGAGLSLFTPAHTIGMAWPLLSAAVLPPLIWHVAMQLPKVRPQTRWRPWLAWLSTSVLIGVALWGSGSMPPVSAMLLGILAASLMWQFRADGAEDVSLGAIGQLTLALLLAEIDLTVSPMRPLVANVVAGSTLGLVLGFVGVRAALRLDRDSARHVLCVGVVYIAYLVALPLDISGVVAALAAGLVLADYGYRAGVWPERAALPAPLNSIGAFALMAGAFLLLGWQAHVDITMRHTLGIGLGLAAAALSLGLGYSLFGMLPRHGHRSLLELLVQREQRILLLLLGTFLLWPQAVVLQPWPLVVAFVGALVGLLISLMVVNALFDVFGIQLRRTEAPSSEERIHVVDSEDRESERTISIWRN